MPKKKKGGRPTLMTPETVKKLEEAFANGATDVQACFYANISKQTLYNYQEKHPEFVGRKEGLKAQLGLIAKNQVAKAIKSGDVNKAAWYLERKEKDEFSLKTEQDTNIKGDLSFTVTKNIIHAKTGDK